MSKSQFIISSEKFTRWCRAALTYWHERALDPRGGYAEHLFMSGKADFDHIRRVRVQSRLAYVYAHAGALSWYDRAQSACDHAWEFVCEAGHEGNDDITPPKGYAHLVSGSGVLVDGMRDTYAQAFILLAAAWRYKAFQDELALRVANETIEFLNMHVKAENGGWYESFPREHPVAQRRQNPHMHLFEAFLALYNVTNNQTYLSLADEIFTLFETHYINAKQGVLLEFFQADWSPLGDGGPIEPGHMMEWCWLLEQYGRLAKKDLSKYCETLFDAAHHYGWSNDLGLICDIVSLDQTPLTKTYRTWPQTECLKATIARVYQGDEDKLSFASEIIETLLSRYLSVTEQGGWVDQLSDTGEILTDVMPSSTFYHLFCAAAEVDKLAKAL